MDQPTPRKRVMSDMQPSPRKAVSVPIKKKTVVVRETVEETVSTTPAPTFYESPRSRDASASNRKPGCLIWFVGLICAVILVLTIGGLWSAARVTVIAQSYMGNVNQTIELSQTQVPGTIRVATATKTFTETKVLPKTGTVNQESFAVGTVRLYNSASRKITVPAHTVITSSGDLNYLTDSTVTLPAAKKTVQGQADMTVTAQEAGSQFNIAPDDFTFSSKYPSLVGRSVTPLAGGSQGADAVADPSQVALATTELTTDLSDTSTLVNRMSDEIPDSMMVLPVEFPQSSPVITIDPSHDDGVHVIGSETISILLVNRSQFAGALATALSVPQGMMLTMNGFDGLTVTTDTLASSTNLPLDLSVRVTGTASLEGLVSTDRIQESLPGLARSEARQLLQKIPEIKSFTISMTPPWRRTFPENAGDITVIQAQ